MKDEIEQIINTAVEETRFADRPERWQIIKEVVEKAYTLGQKSVTNK